MAGETPTPPEREQRVRVEKPIPEKKEGSLSNYLERFRQAQAAWAKRLGGVVLSGDSLTTEQIAEAKEQLIHGQMPPPEAIADQTSASHDKKQQALTAISKIIGLDALKGILPDRKKLDELLEFVKLEVIPIGGAGMTEVLDALGPGKPNEIKDSALMPALGALMADDETESGLNDALAELRGAVSPANRADPQFQREFRAIANYITARKAAIVATAGPDLDIMAQRQYYRKNAERIELDEAPDADKMLAQAMKKWKDKAENFGLESADGTPIEVMVIRALRPDIVNTPEGLHKALCITIAALRELDFSAGNFKTVSEHFEELLRGNPESERILDTMNFIYYATLYEKAARAADKDFNAFSDYLMKYTRTEEKASPDRYKLSDGMIVAAHQKGREGKYLLPYLTTTTNMLNDPKIVYQIQRARELEKGGKKPGPDTGLTKYTENPRGWLIANVIDPILSGQRVEIHGAYGTYIFDPADGSAIKRRELIAQQAWLGFDFWEGSGFEDGWKNTPVEMKQDTYRIRFDQAPEDITAPTTARGIPEIAHPFRAGFFGTDHDDPFGALRRLSQFLKDVKQNAQNPRGSMKGELRKALEKSQEYLEAINKFGKVYMTYGEMATQLLYRGQVDCLTYDKDEVLGSPPCSIAAENRPNGSAYRIPPNELPNNMSDLLVLLSEDEGVPGPNGTRKIGAIRSLWKKSSNMSKALGPLIAAHLGTPPKSFIEAAAQVVGPLIHEVAREPNPMMVDDAVKVLEAEVLVGDIIPAVAAYCASHGIRFYKEEIEAFFKVTKAENLWYENPGLLAQVIVTGTRGIGGGQEAILSKQGRQLRGKLGELLVLSAQLEPNPSRPKYDTAGYAQLMINLMAGAKGK